MLGEKKKNPHMQVKKEIMTKKKKSENFKTFLQHFILTKQYFISSLESNPVSHPEAIFSLLDSVRAEVLSLYDHYSKCHIQIQYVPKVT